MCIKPRDLFMIHDSMQVPGPQGATVEIEEGQYLLQCSTEAEGSVHLLSGW